MKTVLEVCVDSLASARAAIAGGADRLKLCSALLAGGLTPYEMLLRQIKAESDIPVRCLMRPRPGDFLYTQEELELLRQQIVQLRNAGADGFVIGCLTPDGELDCNAMLPLIDACGGLPEDTGKVIGGGPMMGKALVNTDVPTAKGSSGILIMNDKEARRGEPQPCIRCAKCVGACPMGLEPFLLATVSSLGDFEKVEKEDIMSCIECGSCQFTCPSNRPLLDYIRLGKGKVGAMIRARQAKK